MSDCIVKASRALTAAHPLRRSLPLQTAAAPRHKNLPPDTAQARSARSPDTALRLRATESRSLSEFTELNRIH